MYDIFNDSSPDNLIRIWENERKSRDLCAILMWENVKYFATFFGALLVAHSALLTFLWPQGADVFTPLVKGSILIFPIAIVALSLYAYSDLKRRWDRFLLVAAQLCKLEVLLGLHDDIAEKLNRYQKEDLTSFQEDKFLFKDYRYNLKHANSDAFWSQGTKWNIRTTTTLASMGWIYAIIISIGIGLAAFDIYLISS